MLVLARFFTEQETCRTQPKIRNDRFLPRVCIKKQNKAKNPQVLAGWLSVRPGLPYPSTRLNPSTTRANVSFPVQSTSIRTTGSREALTVHYEHPWTTTLVYKEPDRKMCSLVRTSYTATGQKRNKEITSQLIVSSVVGMQASRDFSMETLF